MIGGDIIVTRESQEPDVLYVHGESGMAFVSPDGIGRYWYDSEGEADEEYGYVTRVEYVDGWDE